MQVEAENGDDLRKGWFLEWMYGVVEPLTIRAYSLQPLGVCEEPMGRIRNDLHLFSQDVGCISYSNILIIRVVGAAPRSYDKKMIGVEVVLIDNS